MPNRILTTHVGSLIRPAKLIDFWRLIEEGNSTSEFLNYVTCLGIVEERKPTFIDHKPVKGVGTCPVAFWDLTGAAA